MIYAKIQPQPRVWRRRFFKVFTIYGHGGHLGQRTVTILAIFRSPQPKEAPYEIGPEAPEKLFEILNIFPIQMHKEAKVTLP